MSEQKIEVVINDVLKGDAQKNALDFAQYLKSNEMVANGAEVSNNGTPVCYIHIDGSDEKPGPWTIWTEGDYTQEHKDVLLDEHMKKIAWANVNICGDCGAGCGPEKRKVIFGKEFDNVCNAIMAFNNPNAETLECVKKLIEMRKNIIN